MNYGAPCERGAGLNLKTHKSPQAEFKLVFKNWVRHRVDWRAIFPHTDLGNLDIMDDLMDVDIGAVYHGLMKSDPDRSKFGFMPLLASCCTSEIGALNAESYAERIVSAANLTMNSGNTRFDDELCEMLVVLRMNREFIIFMRDNYFEDIRSVQRFNTTVVADESDEKE